jgi:predicted dehydrogenase
MERSRDEQQPLADAARVRVGVVGCGLIAQLMHLPYLTELSDRFELAALCDASPDVLAACAERYGVPRTFSRWEDLVAEPLDAVMVLTSGSHAPMAIAAARAGRHVFVEKPLALSAAEGTAMLDAAAQAGVRLMVGTMKRYDPAYERLVELLGDVDDVRLVQSTTLESPLEPYVAHRALVRPDSPPAFVADRAAEEAALDGALGQGASEQERWCYRFILLDNLVHEFNMLRGALGEPDAVRYARLDPRSAAVQLAFGGTECHLSWVDLPGIARYQQELAFHSPDERLVITFPSPFLPNAPTRLRAEAGTAGTAHAWARDEVVSYEEAFKRELVEFHAAIAQDREARTSGLDGLRDLLLCEAVARVARTGTPIERPTDVAAMDELRGTA